MAIAELAVKFKDFSDRYERDTLKAETDRKELLDIVKSHDDFIRQIRPMYTKGTIALGAFVLGSIGIATHALWSHFIWK